MILSISEILNLINQQETTEQAINILKNNDSNQLRQFLKYCFDPTIEFYITEFPTKYYNPIPEINIPGNAPKSIKSELSKTYLFRKNNPQADNLSQEQKEFILANKFLDYMDKEEAKYFTQMLTKSLQSKFINKNLIKSIYPGLI